ncbi:hypothetical protein QTP81_04220 [Alteromonas sp. ASW11-36]|uniref:TonB C-terminal domain-containing protein n=1 Tax=Alteromonas arenosi TaxID=3055817 RepID=A0ABT7SUG7_9ALTE|nr:hypothetical protein [Alteromonas sp. ASW11-36]MDM7859805.1 hypothetical protein [Alteromonas sp. ASW11-36]
MITTFIALNLLLLTFSSQAEDRRYPKEFENEITSLKMAVKRLVAKGFEKALKAHVHLPDKHTPFIARVSIQFSPSGSILSMRVTTTPHNVANQTAIEQGIRR